MSENPKNFSRMQLTVLIVLRVLIGYHFLFLGLEKLFNPSWSAAGFLLQANGLFAGFYQSMAADASTMAMIDFLNTWGQIFIGAGMIAGAFSRLACWAGALLLFLYYTANPPFMSGYFFIDKNMLEFLAIVLLALFPTSHLIGIDHFFNKTGSA
ncbi:MAG: DoxX family membrane protein [Calditrichaeota bacterium]|nr:MAG: DoxX family membrane protein [Calditrichota bacterium]